MHCKCHGKTLIEIKCPFNIRNKTIQGVHECFFIVEKDWVLALLWRCRYYTQIISQMGLTGKHSCYFIVWTLKDIFVQIVKLDEQLQSKVNTNLKLYYKPFVCPVLLEFKPITYCGNCDTVLLEESKIQEVEEGELNSIQYLWYLCLMFSLIMCISPSPFCLGGGRVEPPTKFAKRGAWQDLFLEGDAGKEGSKFFSGDVGCNFPTKNKLKSGMLNDKKSS